MYRQWRNPVWYSTADLIGLPGLPKTHQAINRKAIKEQWLFRKRQALGGGREYHLESLPPETQAALKESLPIASPKLSLPVPQPGLTYIRGTATHFQPPSTPDEYNPPSEPKAERGSGRSPENAMAFGDLREKGDRTAFHNGPEANQIEAFGDLKDSRDRTVHQTASGEDRIDAKIAILKALERFCQDQGLRKINCQHIFADKYNRGEIPVDGRIPHISPITLHRWQKTIQAKGVNALAGNLSSRKGQTKIDTHEGLKALALGMLVDFPHATGTHVRAALRARFEPELVPSLRTIERWIKRWKSENRELYTAVSNPDAWKSNYMMAQGSYSEGVTYPNQIWEMDSSPADIMLPDGRYHLIASIDVFSRRAVILLTKQSKSVAIAALVRYCLIHWGVPTVIKTDNGKDYTSNYLQRVFMELGIEQKLCAPFQPWQKPHVERYFRSFAHDLLELMPGYIGHNVAERKAIESGKSFADRLMTKGQVIESKLTPTEFQQFIDRWKEDYLHRPHEGLDMRSPFQVLNSDRTPIRVIENERLLDILLAEAPGSSGLRTVQKRGIQVEGDWFVAVELESWIRQQVQVRFDPQDMGEIYVLSTLGEFICTAQNLERKGISRQEVAVVSKQRQQKRVAEAKKALKQVAKQAKTTEIVNEILTQREAVTERLVGFPKPEELYDSEGLRVAQEVLEALNPQPMAPMTKEELVAGEAALERLSAQSITPEVIRDDDYFCRLWNQVVAGQYVSADDRAWMKHFSSTKEGRGVLRWLEVTSDEVLRKLG